MSESLIDEVPEGWAELHDLLDKQINSSTDSNIEVHCLAYKNPYTDVIYRLARYRTLRSGILGYDVFKVTPDGSILELNNFNNGRGGAFAEWKRLCLVP
jgi:hypothetical protein